MATTKLTPGDICRFRTQPDVKARYLYTRADGTLAVYTMGTYVEEQTWPLDGTEVIEPATEASFGYAIQDNPKIKVWRKQNGRKPTLAEASAILDARGILITDTVPATPATPVVYTCLECGAEYDRPGFVEDGGMGCTRCNH